MIRFMVVTDGRERSLMSFIDFNAFMDWVRDQKEVKIVASPEFHEPMTIEVKKWHQAAA